MPANPILHRMLDRLYAAIVRGPALNCRPHNSRQRVDLTHLERLHDATSTRVLLELLGDPRRAEVAARVPMPAELRGERFPSRGKDAEVEDDSPGANKPGGPAGVITEGELKPDKPDKPDQPSADVLAYRRQQSLLTKLRGLTNDAKTYEQDTGVPALFIGYPIVSLPPGATGGTRRILAPLAFAPVSLDVATGVKAGVKLACRGQGSDLVQPNDALLAYLERETGAVFGELLGDEDGERPWEEVAELVALAADRLGIHLGEPQLQALVDPHFIGLEPVPKAEDLPERPAILRSAVLGLFPTSKQGLMRDTRAMIEAADVPPPVRPFVDAEAALQPQEHDTPDPGEQIDRRPREYAAERFVALADPFQARTVELARSERALVMHGPPGTGKSQTITNIIGDHLARGQRVLFVCEKRTALEVVANRLEHLGLGGLLAVVHDPQRDQRDLYMGIRARLEALTDTKTRVRAEGRVDKIDEELSAIHAELTEARAALMDGSPEGGPSLHEMMGRWLATPGPAVPPKDDPLSGVGLAELDAVTPPLEAVMRRAESIGWDTNPWREACGGSLDGYLARPVEPMREAVATVADRAAAADATHDDAIPPFRPDRELRQQASLREDAADRLRWLAGNADVSVLQRAAGWDVATLDDVGRRLRDAELHRRQLEAPLDDELDLMTREQPLGINDVNRQTGELDRYLEAMSKWYSFLCFAAKKGGAEVMRGYGMSASVENAERLLKFLTGYRARLLLSALHRRITGDPPEPRPVDDDTIRDSIAHHERAALLLDLVKDDGVLDDRVRAALRDGEQRVTVLHGLDRSRPRAEALVGLETSLQQAGVFDPQWARQRAVAMREGGRFGDEAEALRDKFDDLEACLRIDDAVAALPDAIGFAATTLMQLGVEPGEALDTMRKRVLADAVARRLAGDPKLLRLDPTRLAGLIDRHRSLEDQKRKLVADAVLHQWVDRQKRRLLANTQSRLNSDGARLRQRLFVRGKRAMRLRQVVHLGQPPEETSRDTHDAAEGPPPTSGGDPLFDMCPVWLCSPETVAQVFPLRPVFDVLIFDEASQLRLEEALPVLARADRVVIAGDPKQLPPTRFFEAGLASSDEIELESDADVFEAQQSEVEDLLGAALNLRIAETYLDVHYRSRNADLIGFSNEQFYHDRLQAIPGHPSRIETIPPVRLRRADGVYDARCNPVEADAVVAVVKELLERDDPPSIGIACFNLVQRDLIEERLDNAAAEDGGFARRLAAARERRGDGSFEGLFVKNLENVQGDERDHIIISTTYGPTPEGKFHRQFGPLNMPGGWRRLNVLVTRARERVQLVTSIPPEAYRHAAELPQGAQPSGGWLLFAYLRYAERLEQFYEQLEGELERGEGELVPRPEHAVIREIPPVSRFSLALAERLADEAGVPSEAHWGNRGFCVDLALHPKRQTTEAPHDPGGLRGANGRITGVLCDFARFDHAPDPVEWEVYRTGILQWQGWDLQRLWTPAFFRDPQRAVNQLLEAHHDNHRDTEAQS